MKEATINLWNEIVKKYKLLDRWKRNIIMFCIISMCFFLFLDLINIREWWHWNEWMNHITSEHM